MCARASVLSLSLSASCLCLFYSHLALSCPKHFFGYNLENCYTLGDNCRLNFNAVVDQSDIEDTYLVAFHDAVERGSLSPSLSRLSCARSFSLLHSLSLTLFG